MLTPNRLTAGAIALTAARQLTGEPYLFGGTAPGPTDCSGLVEWAWRQAGVTIGRSTYAQYLQFPLGKLQPSQPGDLLFIAGSDPGPHGEPGHVMMYVSPGQIFQAPFTGEDIGQYPYDTDIFEYRTRPALALPMPPAPTKFPSPQVLTAHGYVMLAGPAQAQEAKTNGWQLLIWNGIGFTNSPPNLLTGTPEYASIHWQSKNPNPVA